MAKVHQEVTSSVLIDWMRGPDGKICGSRSGQHQMCVLAESQLLSGPALPTIDDTQLGSHCSDTCLCLFQCCFEMVFWWTCPSSRPTLGGKGKRGWAQHVNVIPSIDQVLMSWIVAQSISILSYDTCVFQFSLTERKLIHGSICLVSSELFLEGPYAFFRPYYLTPTALIWNFFQRVFLRNCARERLIW